MSYLGSDELLAECRVGIAAKGKLRKVIEWVKQTGSTYCSIPTPSHQVFVVDTESLCYFYSRVAIFFT